MTARKPRDTAAAQVQVPFAWITRESYWRLKRGGNGARGTVPIHAAYSHVACMPLFTAHSAAALKGKRNG